MEIKTREELIQCWNDNIKDKEPAVFLLNIEKYLEFISQDKLEDELVSAISSISEIKKYISDEFLKLSKFDEIIKYVNDYKNKSLLSFKELDEYNYLFIILEFLHNKLITYKYNDTEIENIFEAYEEIFKTKDDENGNKLKQDLIHYLDLDNERKRDYSVITSNFLMGKDDFVNKLKEENGVYEAKLLEISKGLNDLNEKRKKLEKEEKDFFERYFKEDLFSYVKKSPIGSSIGIDPLTDDLLLRSFKPGKKDVIIILGRDSYPCFHLDKNKLYHYFQPPLQNYSMYNHNSFYKLFGTKKEKEFKEIEGLMDEHIFLFLNLYPDFRPEFENTSDSFKPDPKFVEIASRSGREGNLTKCFDYCAEKFESVIQIIQSNLNIKAIISLGPPVKRSLVRSGNIYQNGSDSAIADEKIVKIEQEKISHFRYKDESRIVDINYIPIYHPYAAKEFNWKYNNTGKTYNEKYFEILEEILKPDSSS